MGAAEDGHLESVRDEAFDGNGLNMIQDMMDTLRNRHYVYNLVNKICAELTVILGNFPDFILNSERLPTPEELGSFQRKLLPVLEGNSKIEVPENMQELIDTIRSAISDTANSA